MNAKVVIFSTQIPLTEIIIKEFMRVDVIGSEERRKNVTSSTEDDDLVSYDCCRVEIPLGYPLPLVRKGLKRMAYKGLINLLFLTLFGNFLQV